MKVSSDEIARIVARVLHQLDEKKEPEQQRAQEMPSACALGNSRYNGAFPDVSSAVNAAKKAFQELRGLTVSQREKMVFEIRRICTEHLETLARQAFEETGLGRWEDKIEKNRLVIEKTPGTEDLHPQAFSGDFGLTLVENAPYGIIGAITPMTNPTETIICNSIGMIAAGNAVVFNAHPKAKRCSAYAVHLINTAVVKAGGPANLAAIVEHPTMESASELMTHPDIRILVVTGGGGVVKAAFGSGKKVIAAGPGNPPAIVDETADLEKAAKDIIAGASLDNNILCIAEKEVFVVQSVADRFCDALRRNGAYQVIGSNIGRLESLIWRDGHISAELIGKNAGYILSQIGVHCGPEIRLGFFECSADHFLVKAEQMMPIMPVVRVPDVKEAIELALKAEGGNFHTATMHSLNLAALHEMAMRSNVSIFVKNGPSFAGLGMGGEGPTTMSIASPTGEGITTSRTFTRSRRCVLKGHFRIV
jgi:propionaldehyde dehydrogenase